MDKSSYNTYSNNKGYDMEEGYVHKTKEIEGHQYTIWKCSKCHEEHILGEVIGCKANNGKRHMFSEPVYVKVK